MTTYIATFERIGRTHDVEFVVRGGDADAVAAAVYNKVGRYLMSRDVEVTVDLEVGAAYVSAGFHNAGTGVLTEVVEATS